MFEKLDFDLCCATNLCFDLMQGTFCVSISFCQGRPHFMIKKWRLYGYEVEMQRVSLDTRRERRENHCCEHSSSLVEPKGNSDDPYRGKASLGSHLKKQKV